MFGESPSLKPAMDATRCGHKCKTMAAFVPAPRESAGTQGERPIKEHAG